MSIGRLIALGVVLALTAALFRAKPAARPARRTTKVRAHAFRKTIRVVATLEAAQSFEAFAPVEVDALLIFLARDGSRVKKGDVVARFASDEVDEKILEKVIERDTVKLELAIKREELDLESFEVGNRVAFATEDLAVARLARELVETGVDAVEYTRLTQQLEANGQLLSKLAESIREMEPYVARGFVSKDDFDKQRTRDSTEKIAREALSLDRSVVVSGATTDKRADARFEIEKARAALELAQVKQKTFAQRRADATAEIEAKLKGAEEELAFMNRQVSLCTVKTPIDGVFLIGQTFTESVNQTKVREGMKVYGGFRFAEVASPGKVELEMALSEADARFVREGMELSFVLDAYPGSRFRAKVTRMPAALSGVEHSRWYFPEFREVKARAAVLEVDERLLPGMSVVADLVVEERPSALWLDVPFLEGDHVRLLHGETRRVTTGHVGFDEVEIVGGLKEGDEVVSPRETVVPVPPSDPATVPVTRRDLVLTFSGAGTLTPASIHEMLLKDLEGEAVIETMAADGAAVKKGQRIARLDDQVLQSKRKERDLELTVAEKELSVVREQSKVDLDTLTQELDVAVIGEKVAALEARLVELGKKPRELANLELDLKNAETDIALIRKKLELKGALSAKGWVSEEEVKNLRLTLAEKTVSLEVARTQYELARRGATPVEREKAVASHKRAAIGLDLARRKLESRKRKRAMEVAKAELSVRKSKMAKDRFKRMVGSCKVTAPADGTVIRAERWGTSGVRKYQEGDSIRKGTAFMRVAGLDRFIIEGIVPEGRIAVVKAGQPLRFALTSFPDDKYPGRIETVGRVAREKDDSSGSLSRLDRIFDIVISVADSRPRFQPGLSVSFDVEYGKLEKVLAVPVEALRYDGEGPYVFDASRALRRVAIGEESGGYVQIVRGLAEGEGILVSHAGR